MTLLLTNSLIHSIYHNSINEVFIAYGIFYAAKSTFINNIIIARLAKVSLSFEAQIKIQLPP